MAVKKLWNATRWSGFALAFWKSIKSRISTQGSRIFWNCITQFMATNPNWFDSNRLISRFKHLINCKCSQKELLLFDHRLIHICFSIQFKIPSPGIKNFRGGGLATCHDILHQIGGSTRPRLKLEWIIWLLIKGSFKHRLLFCEALKVNEYPMKRPSFQLFNFSYFYWFNRVMQDFF
jgi:hypothetical protein